MALATPFSSYVPIISTGCGSTHGWGVKLFICLLFSMIVPAKVGIIVVSDDIICALSVNKFLESGNFAPKLLKVMKSLIKFWKSTSLVLKILIGMVVGVVLGLTLPEWSFVALLGKVFVGALKAMAPVLVAVLVAGAIAKAGSGLGARFRTVIFFYLATTLVAAMVAVVASYVFPVQMTLSEATEGSAPGGLSDVFSKMVHDMVSNPIQSVANANYIGVLFWSIVVGLALKHKAGAQTIEVVSDLAEVVSTVIRWIIEFAPLGILGLVFSSVSESGLYIFTDYGKLLALLVGCMLFTSLVVNPLIIALYLRANPYPIVWVCLKESAVNAFFTRSSAANIPMNMSLCKRLKVDTDFYSVSIPLGCTINMNGAAVTITVMTLAVCHSLGIAVSLPAALLLSLICTLGACGSSGVAGGSLLLIPMACSLFGINNDMAMQAVAVGFIIGVVQDSVETALNSSGDALFTIVADLHSKGKKPADIADLLSGEGKNRC